MRPVSSVRRLPPHSMLLRLISNILDLSHYPEGPFLRGRTGAERRFLFAGPGVLSIDRRMRTAFQPSTCGNADQLGSEAPRPPACQGGERRKDNIGAFAPKGERYDCRRT